MSGSGGLAAREPGAWVAPRVAVPSCLLGGHTIHASCTTDPLTVALARVEAAEQALEAKRAAMRRTLAQRPRQLTLWVNGRGYVAPRRRCACCGAWFRAGDARQATCHRAPCVRLSKRLHKRAHDAHERERALVAPVVAPTPDRCPCGARLRYTVTHEGYAVEGCTDPACAGASWRRIARRLAA